MSDSYNHEPMLDLFIFESLQLIEQMELLIISNENASFFSMDVINEIFRIMHTIKGSSAMMLFQNISLLAHAMEDLFFVLREEKPPNVNYSELSDLVLGGIDFIKAEIDKIKNGWEADGDASELINSFQVFLSVIKGWNSTDEDWDPPHPERAVENSETETAAVKNIFAATLFFDLDCGMENLRAFGVVNDLEDMVEDYCHIPEDLDAEDSAGIIRDQGFKLLITTDCSWEEIHRVLSQTISLRELQLTQGDNNRPGDEVSEERKMLLKSRAKNPCLSSDPSHDPEDREMRPGLTSQSMISVNVGKLDQLMDLVGEMVIAEAMVIQNPDLKGLELENFQKAARQLNKLTSELQDVVMSIRMVPLSLTFQKMQRLVRDMSKKLGKEARLEIIGEKTEVDKNIIEHISDPLMHLVRNALDHGLESSESRRSKGKNQVGTVTLEAKNAGSDVLVMVKDDGKGLMKETILKRARENNLLYKPESEMSEREIYNLIFLPGFSTKDSVSEFSGRGVGMDVVSKNIEAVGGSVAIDSIPDRGTTITLKIPLTLAIIDGMNIKVGYSRYTIPITSIKESFRPKDKEIITDPDGNEMIMVRGRCYPILRLHELYQVKTARTKFTEGIMIMVEEDEKSFCIFADELLGQQQVVVKALPDYVRGFREIKGLAGCTLLGDGSISLILDVAGLTRL